jgi:hypothetical protein
MDKVSSFYRTHYQLACQLGLYQLTSGRYFRKFNFTPTEQQGLSIQETEIIHYCVPNPYTRKFEDLKPFSIHEALCRNLFTAGKSINWDTILQAIFNTDITNKDILRML